MVVYKVYRRDYWLQKGKLLGVLAERRKDLRGKSQLESGLRWAMLTFGQSLKDKRSIFIVPKELDVEMARKALMEKGIFSTQEFLHVAGPHAFTQETGVRGRNLRAKEIGGKSPSAFHFKKLTSYDWFYGFSERPFNVTPIRGFSI